jgi:hypothetical protein
VPPAKFRRCLRHKCSARLADPSGKGDRRLKLNERAGTKVISACDRSAVVINSYNREHSLACFAGMRTGCGGGSPDSCGSAPLRAFDIALNLAGG